MSSVWPGTDAFRTHFQANLKKYAVDEPFSHLDVYWNPRAGAWQSFASVKNVGLATSDRPTGYAGDPGLYEEITTQWNAMDPDTHQRAVWDPRKHQWLVAEPKMSQENPAEAEYETELAYFKSLLDAGKLTPAQYDDAVRQLNSRYLNPPR